MKRSLLLAATLIVFAFALAFSSPSRSSLALADQPDPCVKCQIKVQHEFEKCEAKFGVSQFCYDQFNQGIIDCFATVCEQ